MITAEMFLKTNDDFQGIIFVNKLDVLEQEDMAKAMEEFAKQKAIEFLNDLRNNADYYVMPGEERNSEEFYDIFINYEKQ